MPCCTGSQTAKRGGYQKLHVQDLYNVPYMVKPPKKNIVMVSCDATQKDLYKLHLKWYSTKPRQNRGKNASYDAAVFYGKISVDVESGLTLSVMLHREQSRVSGHLR